VEAAHGGGHSAERIGPAHLKPESAAVAQKQAHSSAHHLRVRKGIVDCQAFGSSNIQQSIKNVLNTAPDPRQSVPQKGVHLAAAYQCAFAPLA
jgi:hypothetical protein